MAKHMMFLLYILAAALVTFSVATISYQYIAALGSPDKVIAALGNDRILMTL